MATKTKTQALGTCDHCLGPIPADLGHYTSKGKPRLYCSRLCQNTANSRAGSPARSRKARQRVRRGQWVNPATLNKPDPANIGAGVSRLRKKQVKAGTWRNPALTDEARAKLSRPRVHGDNPTLHSAMEKLRQGTSVSDLTDAEAEAQRAKWREANRRKSKKSRWRQK